MDKQRLIDVFSPLGYEVEAHDNVDHLKMIGLIRSACDRSQLRDSLIVCILSHGFEGAVYGADSIPLSIEDVKNVLCADENLHDKPKMLFIQACQQNEKQLRTVDERKLSVIEFRTFRVSLYVFAAQCECQNALGQPVGKHGGGHVHGAGICCSTAQCAGQLVHPDAVRHCAEACKEVNS